MPQLARLEFTIQDAAGNAVSGASVEVRRQGAQVFGAHVGAVTTINVDSPGAVVAGDTVAINTGTTTRSVSSITATTVVVGGAGFNSPADDDRITIVSALPTIYEDAEGVTSKSNPLTTDANGYASCFVVGGKYDVKLSGGGLTTRLIQDVAAVGGESLLSTVYGGGGFQNGWNIDTLRTLDSGDALVRFAEAGTERFRLKAGGGFTSGAVASSTISGPLAVNGALTATAGEAVTGAITATTTITAGTGLIATTGGLTVSAGGATVTGNSIITGSLTGVTGLTCQAIYHTIPTLTVNSTTPTVSAGTVFAENNSNPTSITDFTPHNDGQEISIIINTTNTTFVDGATLQMAGGVNFNPNGNDVVTFVQWGGTWYEKSRSVN